MIAHYIKKVFELAPETMTMVKKASLDEEFPLNNVDDVCASYLVMNYMTKVAGVPVSPEIISHIGHAVNLYNIKSKLDNVIKERMLKKANMNPFAMNRNQEQSNFSSNLHNQLNLEKTAEEAGRLYSKYNGDVDNEDILRYCGKGYLNKQGAYRGLAARYIKTKQEGFLKVAEVIKSMPLDDFSSNKALCETVTQLDKTAGLDILGFDFYKDALIVKKAELSSMLMLNLAGENVPYEKFLKFGKDRVASTIGNDVASALTDDPAHNKQVIETLPRDIQQVLKNLIKSC